MSNYGEIIGPLGNNYGEIIGPLTAIIVWTTMVKEKEQ